MSRSSRLLASAIIGCVFAAVALAGSGSESYAQQQKPATDAAQPAPASEAGDLQQIALTEKQIQGLLEAQKDMDAITSKLPEDKAPDPKVMIQLDAVAKKYGFASYAEYGNVAANADMLLDGFDPQTKKFVGFETVLKSQIAHIQADPKIQPTDKKEALDELNAALKNIPKVEYPGNIEIVGKYYDKLSDALRGQE